MTPLYVEEVHMLQGLDDEELETYLEENPQIVPFFEIDVIETVRAYTTPTTAGAEDCEPDMEALMELRRAHDVFNREMEISRCIEATTLE